MGVAPPSETNEAAGSFRVGSREPLPPGCLGLVFAGLTVGLGVGITAYALESAHRGGTLGALVGSYFGAVGVLAVAVITIPLAAVLVYAFGTAIVRRRRMVAEMERVVVEPPDRSSSEP